MDKIIVKNLKIFAYHGVNPEEKTDGQNFVFDITAFLNLKEACKSDNVDDTVSYAKIIKAVTRIVTSEKNDLLEYVAQRVSDGLFYEFPKIQRLKITLKKPEAPIKADFEWVAVEIERNRE